MEIIEALKQKDLGVKKNLLTSPPVSSVGYSEVQMRLNEKHLKALSTLKKCLLLFKPS